jgi:integrase
MTTGIPLPAPSQAPPRPRWRSAEVAALLDRFPPRPARMWWAETAAGRAAVVGRLLAPPFTMATSSGQHYRRLGMLRVLDWLGGQPGGTWQDRWIAGLDGRAGTTDWRLAPLAWLRATGRVAAGNSSIVSGLGAGLMLLIGGDVIRPAVGWLLSTASPQRLAAEMARVRDPDGFAALAKAAASLPVGQSVAGSALDSIAVIMAAKGGMVAGITVGDCLELLEASVGVAAGERARSPHVYRLLHAAGVFGPGAPSTVRMLNPRIEGQRTAEQMIGRYQLSCRPVRDVLIDYLRERQPGVDYATLENLATILGLRFWKDLEVHHPGIGSLRLPPSVAAAWKQRLQTKTVRVKGADGRVVETVAPRVAAADCMITVRGFYLDIAQWAVMDQARWGPWAAPSPIAESDIQAKKANAETKSRMDQRTRERLPAVPALADAADQARKDAAQLLQAARNSQPGAVFTAAGQTLRRAVLTVPSPLIWAEDAGAGERRNLSKAEDDAFWAWAAIEILRHTGIRVEELTELSHYSLIQYRHPATGEVIPLLHIAPSKMDEERMLVISPELADALATILRRIRGALGTVPLVDFYDSREREWKAPLPLLLQHMVAGENRPVNDDAIRRRITQTAARAGLRDVAGKLLSLAPHDFRRIFVTDAIMNGMPPHICQLIMGHRSITTTIGYKAVYPEETIAGHRAFIARRRQLRPSEEYRTPTESEWEEFLGHFERRRLALGDCGRAYGSACVHEHACVRCSLLRLDPAQRPRLEEIRANLIARITEAEKEGWLGEADGMRTSLAAATAKLAQLDARAARHATAVDLGMPRFSDVAGLTATAPATLPQDGPR